LLSSSDDFEIGSSQKVVALTFDADMTPRMSNELKTGKIASWYNQTVIATLREEHVPATLFLAGLWIERYPAVTQDLSADPLFEIGNHSYSHPGFHSPCYGLGSVQKSNQAAEVQKTDALLKKTIPSSVAMFTAVTGSRRAQLKSFRTYWFTCGQVASSSSICTVAQMRRKRQMRFPMSLGNFACEDTRS
jgi:peptidoglycan/xylan/chitin deacetylase (PgdA/CDA1 family)